MENQVSSQYCAEQVRRMARRTALLYHYFAATLVEELGEERAKELVAQVIHRYGDHCGRSVREQVEAQGLPPEPENYNKGRDLPELGWESASLELPSGQQADVVTYCPLAEVFQELGSVALGRLYCYVDQAKQSAYNPDYEFIHANNVLDGDPYCRFVVQKVDRKA